MAQFLHQLTLLFGGIFTPTFVLPLLLSGYALSFILTIVSVPMTPISNPRHWQRARAGTMLTTLTTIGWLFLTVVTYNLSNQHHARQWTVMVWMIPWYTLWFVYSVSLVLGAMHAWAHKVAKVATTPVDPSPPTDQPDHDS